METVMQEDHIDWRPCGHCVRGRVVLLISNTACGKCCSTGIDLADPRLGVPVENLVFTVRTRKYLLRQHVTTLGELLRFAALGALGPLAEKSVTSVTEIRRVLRENGLAIPSARAGIIL